MATQFDAQIGLVCDTIDAAEKLSAGLKSGLEQVKKGAAMIASVMPETAKLLDRIVVLTELETAKIRMSLTQDQKKALTREWEKMAAAAKAGAQPPVPGTLAGTAPTTATQGNATPPPPSGSGQPPRHLHRVIGRAVECGPLGEPGLAPGRGDQTGYVLCLAVDDCVSLTCG